MQVPEYVRRVEAARPAVFRLFTELAGVNRFKDISDDLNIDPFDTIVQSVYYLPWALLKVDPAGAQVRKWLCSVKCVRWLNGEELSCALFPFVNGLPSTKFLCVDSDVKKLVSSWLSSEASREPSSEASRELSSEASREPSSETSRELSSETSREPYSEASRELSSEASAMLFLVHRPYRD
eukprot:1137365-Pelagomonas_calceolata.AAC.1